MANDKPISTNTSASKLIPTAQAKTFIKTSFAKTCLSVASVSPTSNTSELIPVLTGTPKAYEVGAGERKTEDGAKFGNVGVHARKSAVKVVIEDEVNWDSPEDVAELLDDGVAFAFADLNSSKFLGLDRGVARQRNDLSFDSTLIEAVTAAGNDHTVDADTTDPVGLAKALGKAIGQLSKRGVSYENISVAVASDLDIVLLTTFSQSFDTLKAYPNGIKDLVPAGVKVALDQNLCGLTDTPGADQTCAFVWETRSAPIGVRTDLQFAKSTEAPYGLTFDDDGNITGLNDAFSNNAEILRWEMRVGATVVDEDKVFRIVNTGSSQS